MSKDGRLKRIKGDLKIVRVNFHFMLKSDGTGNFNEKNDGSGRNFSGYDYARRMLYFMNAQCIQNVQLNIPAGNTIPVRNKNYRYVLDAVYFWRSDSTYLYKTIDYARLGRDKDSVLNVFLSHGTDVLGGYASDVSTTSHYKFTENRSYWYSYRGNLKNGDTTAGIWTHALNTSHELGHLLGLRHTVLRPGGGACPGGCKGGKIDPACDDGCEDTPSAWEILESNECTTHPGCGWSGGITGKKDCSNNLMDYTGMFALSPCQIDKIHRGLENGLGSYLQSSALKRDLSLPDIGYPKLSYFGQNVCIGTAEQKADLEANEKIDVYYSEEVELTNFEAEGTSVIEFILSKETAKP